MNNEIIYRIENEYLILDYYLNDNKIASANAGCIIDILNQVKLYNDEYNTLIKQNKHMIDIAKNYEQLQQENQQLKKELECTIGIAEHNRAIQKYILKERALQIQISVREEEYKKLEDNWNKLKEWLKANDIHYAEVIPFKETLRKMQELERGVSDEQ